MSMTMRNMSMNHGGYHNPSTCCSFVRERERGKERDGWLEWNLEEKARKSVIN
jgi:hypothetical protein